jgi:hypothetical protein
MFFWMLWLPLPPLLLLTLFQRQTRMMIIV